MNNFKTYAIPFIYNHNTAKTLYWNLYDDLSGGFFCTVDEVAPLASLLYLDDCKTVWHYLGKHGLLFEGKQVLIDKIKIGYIKSLGKPVLTNLNIPKTVW